ncbi:MAG: hydrogenase expression/formation protein HypE [Syntrophomonadaceae bacterium]|nr:hydrogenase expression/formation protein HypE [Syntrophomonadaceae bacterium]
MNQERVLLAHGSGGLMSQGLIERIFKQYWSNPHLDDMLDGAVLQLPVNRIAVSTDSFVITPLFFPGGDIGKLAVCGTVNDLVACGARPLYLSAAFIIEEGLSIRDLEQIVKSMAQTAAAAGVKLVTGDTKVVEKGSADQVFINTTGIGVIDSEVSLHPRCIKPGDQVIVTGQVGDHGLAILAQREGLAFSTPAESDCAALHHLSALVSKYPAQIKCMRDPTRGGLATVLNEIATQAGLGIVVEEQRIPVSAVVKGACDMLGMDPLYMANEGKMVIFASREGIDDLMRELLSNPLTQGATIIGEVVANHPGMVLLKTALGAKRILSTLEGEHVPRIC